MCTLTLQAIEKKTSFWTLNVFLTFRCTVLHLVLFKTILVNLRIIAGRWKAELKEIHHIATGACSNSTIGYKR